jgi:hypothetical protein
VEQMLSEQGGNTSAAHVAEEVRKWQMAQAFENATQRIDFAYDGVWYQKDIDVFCSSMRMTKPGAENALKFVLSHFYTKENDQFTKTVSGQT